jgi:hypothetical protein
VMTMANSLRQVRSARNRVPHRTGWGTCGSLQKVGKQDTLLGSLYESAFALITIARPTATTILLIVLNFFR